MKVLKNWWLLINEQRALTFARQHNIKAVTVPEFVVYLYDAHILSYNSENAFGPGRDALRSAFGTDAVTDRKEINGSY